MSFHRSFRFHEDSTKKFSIKIQSYFENDCPDFVALKNQVAHEEIPNETPAKQASKPAKKITRPRKKRRIIKAASSGKSTSSGKVPQPAQRRSGRSTKRRNYAKMQDGQTDEETDED